MASAHALQSSPRMMRFQQSFVGLCVVLLLVGGMVSVPATCDCGAGISHGHSLFTLPGHHHGPEGWQVDAGHADTSGDQSHTVGIAAHSGPQIAGKVAHGADGFSVALANTLTGADIWTPFSYPGDAVWMGSGWLDIPDAPPPRQLLHG